MAFVQYRETVPRVASPFLLVNGVSYVFPEVGIVGAIMAGLDELGPGVPYLG
ncbi:Uncharacterised protein [Kytococcus sedentarius]|nr:Uncharacterised protein [Kytococcus sedentarius]